MTFELSLERYSGPLDKLLGLIEEKKLEITGISLAQVTDDFLKYLRKLPKIETPLLADFIAVASRLILIKSKSLLPSLTLTPEEEGDIKEFEERLKLYQELKPALKYIAALWRRREQEFARPYFLTLSGSTGVFYPGKGLGLPSLVQGLEGLLQSFKSFELETETIRDRIISIEEKVREIIDRLVHEAELSFRRVAHVKSVSEIIAVFLAILHLAHEQRVSLEQREHFSDIIIKKQSQSAG